jgi:hypothetical protein
MKALPKKITKTLYVSLKIDRDLSDYFCMEDPSRAFDVSDYDASRWNSDIALVKKIDVDFYLPEIDVKTIKIERLEAAKQKLMADAQIKIQKIDDEISKLLCIEYSPV